MKKGFGGFSTRPELEIKREKKAQAAQETVETAETPADPPAAETKKPKGE